MENNKLPPWTFLSNHTHVLFVLATEPDIVLREVATKVGITERAVQRILAELEQDGFVNRERDGRRNTYTLNLNKALRHKLERNHTIGDIISLLRRAR